MSAPAIILAEPQLGENIGATARAMANFGLSDLRLVRPRDVWPNPKAQKMAAGADAILDAARVFASVKEAVADLQRVYAATARERAMLKEVVTPEEAARRIRVDAARGARSGILFGAERAGLENDDVALADFIVAIPVKAEFSSINLAQAVIITAYEWFKTGDATPPVRFETEPTRPANKEELVAFFEHFERELDGVGFLYPPEKRPSMVRNLRNMWQRAGLTEQEIRSLRGVITALGKQRK